VQHPPQQLRRQAPRRRIRRRARSHSRPARRLGWRARIILAASALVFALFAWAAFARSLAPTGNTQADHFDAIIVLGATIDRDGNPSPALQARVTEAVREYERGAAPRLIVSGGLSHGHFLQAQAMARIAESQGIPASAVFLEPNAQNTIENACFSVRIMKSHGWTSAEVVSSASHLPRTGIIFSRMPITWRSHAAPPLEPQSGAATSTSQASEIVHTLYYLVYSNWAQRCSP
jgi:uncharacterized SAM-binding protein YcdF (DUF218 family)